MNRACSGDATPSAVAWAGVPKRPGGAVPVAAEDRENPAAPATGSGTENYRCETTERHRTAGLAPATRNPSGSCSALSPHALTTRGPGCTPARLGCPMGGRHTMRGAGQWVPQRPGATGRTRQRCEAERRLEAAPRSPGHFAPGVSRRFRASVVTIGAAFAGCAVPECT